MLFVDIDSELYQVPSQQQSVRPPQQRSAVISSSGLADAHEAEYAIQDTANRQYLNGSFRSKPSEAFQKENFSAFFYEFESDGFPRICRVKCMHKRGTGNIYRRSEIAQQPMARRTVHSADRCRVALELVSR